LRTAVACAWFCCAGALAQRSIPTEIERCTAVALQGERVHHAEATHTSFMLTGESQVLVEQYRTRSCLGFLAAGARHVQSLSLVLRAQDGRELSQSETPSALAYVRHCGAPGEVVFPTLRVLDGQGEVVYSVIESAQERPQALVALESCAALGTPRPQPLDVGPVLEGQSIEQQLSAARAELAGLGYGAGQLIAFGSLTPGEHAAKGAMFDSERCYALIAVGSQQVLDLDLRLFGPSLPLTAAGSDVSRSRAARVKFCAQPPARYVLDISVFQGQGSYAVAALSLNEPARVPGIVGAARIDYAELLARMQARGFEGSVLTSGVVVRNEQLTVPLPVRSGTCYALGVFDSSERVNSASAAVLSLGLKDPNGALLALDTTPGRAPLLFHCADSDARLQVVVGVGPNQRQARFVVMLGRDTEAEKP